MEKEKVAQLKALLTESKRVVIIPHRNPDGDAIGSTLALQEYLSLKGHTAVVIAPNDFPDFLKWMPGTENILFFSENSEQAKQHITEADIIFTLDFNHFSRTGHDMEEVLNKTDSIFVMIDHHQAPANYAEFTYSDTSISSTCQMVYHFLEMLDDTHMLTPEMATCLYVGIMTDTGSFRFASTTSTTHKVIAELIDKGANNSRIHQMVFDTNSTHRMQLLGVALANMKVLPEFKTAYITLSQEELDKHQFKKGDTEGFVNYSLSIKGIIFAAIFIENKQENIIKISLRSKGKFDVNQFARKHYNGGGHINAAGGKSDLPLNKTIISFEHILNNYKNELEHVEE